MRASSPAPNRAQQAEIARWKSLAGQNINMYGSAVWLRAPSADGLQRGWAAEVARLTAVAEYYRSLKGQLVSGSGFQFVNRILRGVEH